MKRITKFFSISFILCMVEIMLFAASGHDEQMQMLTEQQKKILARFNRGEVVVELQVDTRDILSGRIMNAAEYTDGVICTAEKQIRQEYESRVIREAEEQKALELDNPLYDKDINFMHLQGYTNKDIYAWVYIPDTKIDYPVLQHPTSNSYYLNYNIDGSRGYPGCIYTENYNKKDFSDPVTVLYGHNMKNGSMFNGLNGYRDSEFFAEHPYVYIYTEEEILEYKVFGAYEYSNLHILLNHNFESTTVFEKYMKDIFSYRGNFDKEVELTESSRILTLSTCVSGKATNRYVVQGVLNKKYEYPQKIYPENSYYNIIDGNELRIAF